MRLVGDKPTALRAATTPGQLLSQTLSLTLIWVIYHSSWLVSIMVSSVYFRSAGGISRLWSPIGTSV